MPEIVTKQQAWMDADGIRDKRAEASSTYLMPGQEPADKKGKRKDDRLAVVGKVGTAFERYIKTGSADGELPIEYADDVYPGTEGYHSEQMLEKLKSMSGKGVMPAKTAGADPPDDNLEDPVTGKQPEKNPQAGELKPHVDVSAKEPPKLVTEKKAEYWAMPSIGRYPIDTYPQVKTAEAYFDEHRGQFQPEHRREFCFNLVKRAAMLGIELGDDIEKYGSATYAPPAEFRAGIEGRKALVDDEDRALLDKIAQMQSMLAPDDFAMVLHEFDKTAGLDYMYGSDITDAYYSTFGKVAEATDTVVIGNDIMTDHELKEFAKKDFRIIRDTFGDDMATEFKKDPRGIFDSLPVDQKKMIIRMATDNAPK